MVYRKYYNVNSYGVNGPVGPAGFQGLTNIPSGLAFQGGNLRPEPEEQPKLPFQIFVTHIGFRSGYDGYIVSFNLLKEDMFDKNASEIYKAELDTHRVYINGSTGHIFDFDEGKIGLQIEEPVKSILSKEIEIYSRMVSQLSREITSLIR